MGIKANFSSWLFFALIGLQASLVGCAPTEVTSSAATVVPGANCATKRVSVVYQGANEPSYCTNVQSYSGVTISGTAYYQAYPYNTAVADFSSSGGLSGTITTSPIRHAELAVYGPNGSVVQCGETDGSGYFSLSLPQSATDTYTLEVRSRGSNSYVDASVLNCPEEQLPYATSTDFIPNATKTITVTTATVGGTGPAFNIFDQIVNANNFLRTQVSNCATPFPGCTNFSVAQKVEAYWYRGFNPNYYYDAENSGLSFYIPGFSRLFILGGIGGTVVDVDTDHYDNSIILHEYGHFLEDLYTTTDSPGGAHSGTELIDPRLAWGEGWGNFIQAAIRNEPHYRDTRGVPSSGTTGYIFNVPLETLPGTCPYAGCDEPSYPGEGNFREFAITRMLWDLHDTANETGDDISSNFNEIWAVITNLTYGFRNTDLEFRHVGHLNLIQDTLLPSGDDWTTVKSTHLMTDTSEYASYVDNTGSCGKVFNMDPYPITNDAFLLLNMNYYHYHHTGGNFSLQMIGLITDQGAVGYTTEIEPDLDLYLMNSRARLDSQADLIGSAQLISDGVESTSQTETINAGSLAAGDYLIIVVSEAPALGGDRIDYELRVNGVNLCPATVP